KRCRFVSSRRSSASSQKIQSPPAWRRPSLRAAAKSSRQGKSWTRAPHCLQGLDGGVVFDPNRDVAYAVSSSARQVVAFDTNTWAPLYQLPIGEAVTPGQSFGNGVMAVSGDGRWLFLSTPSGVREFALANPNPATQFTLSGFNGVTTAGTP